MKNDFIDIRCEGDAEHFAREATRLVVAKTPTTITLRVPNDWWINFTMQLFIQATEGEDIPADTDPVVDVVFDVVDTRMFREYEDLNNLSDEDIQDMIDEFIDQLDDFSDEDDDDMEDTDQ